MSELTPKPNEYVTRAELLRWVDEYRDLARQQAQFEQVLKVLLQHQADLDKIIAAISQQRKWWERTPPPVGTQQPQNDVVDKVIDEIAQALARLKREHGRK